MSAGYFSDRTRAAPQTEHSPAASPGPAFAKQNALQTRIATVLSASYADLEIRDALETLDVREIRNTAATRRNLRLEVQQELISCNGDVVRDFGQVAEQLKRVGVAIADLNKSCAAIRSHVAAAKRDVGPMLEESTALGAQKDQAETKQKLLTAFNAHYLLSDPELTALTSTAEPVSDAFFEALSQAKKIHNDSQVLLGSEDQQLGLEILEQSSKHLNAAFQKLFRWTQRELKTLDLENPQLGNSIRRALRVLAERPALFQSCLDFFAENREQSLSDSFYIALTGNSSSSSGPTPAKAIELNAHDPLRYVGDMLAWAHSATVGEREALHNLFISDADEISRNIQAGRDSQPWSQLHLSENGYEEVEAFDGKRALNELVDRDLSGVMRQLRQRIEQLVRSHEDATLAYQVSNLVSFYCSVFASLLGSESGIEQTLQPITAMALGQFQDTTRDHIANLHSDVTAAPGDLSAPDFLGEALETMKGLMKSYDTSFATAASGEEKTEGFRVVLAEALDPYLAGCENMAKRMVSPDRQIFALNCLSTTRSTIKGRPYTGEKVSALEEALEAEADRLVQVVRSWFVAESGMQPLLEALDPFMDASTTQEIQRVALLDALNHERLAETAYHLDAFLPAAMEDARAFIGRLDSKATVRDICEKAADYFAEEYENVERLLTAVDDIQGRVQANGVVETDNEPVMLRDIFPRTNDEIRVLLS